MKKVENSSATASPRGGVESSVMRIQSTATKVNMIRRARLTSLRANGEVGPVAGAIGAVSEPRHGGFEAVVRVVGGSRLERGGACEDGIPTRNRPEFMALNTRPKNRRVGVRAPIGAEKQGNACGAKGGRKAEASEGRDAKRSGIDCLRARTPEARKPASREPGVACECHRKAETGGRVGGHPVSRYSSSRRGKLLTGEPDAGDLHVRFGGRGGANQCAVPTPITGCLR